MRKSLALFLCVIGIAAVSADAMARGGGGGGGGFGGGGAGFGGGASMGAAGRDMGSSPRASTQGMANSNAPWTSDQEKGLDRAQERMNQQGLDHQKATSSTRPRQPDSDTR